jgi:Bacterial type II and III secretion system protein
MPLPKPFTAALLTVVAFTPAIVRAQEKAPDTPLTHYKLTYRLLEMDANGKITNSRAYFAIIGAGGDSAPAKIRTGDKFPIVVGTGATGATDIQYEDVGTDIDTFHPRINDRELSLQVSAALSNVAKSAPSLVPNTPIIRQTRWESSVVVTLDKPTIIFISDNTSDTGKTELELTATEIKQP